jgi:hypothetical protein
MKGGTGVVPMPPPVLTMPFLLLFLFRLQQFDAEVEDRCDCQRRRQLIGGHHGGKAADDEHDGRGPQQRSQEALARTQRLAAHFLEQPADSAEGPVQKSGADVKERVDNPTQFAASPCVG